MQESNTRAQLSSHTILIIDDEEMIRDLAREILEMEGYKILCAHDGIEGISIFKDSKEKIDCIILDLTMPRMSGRETFLKLRKINSDVNIILSTGHSKDETAQEIIALGVQGVVQKPYKIEELIQVVQKILNE